MSRIVYVNGRYRPYADASVHFEDRGYQFSDGVYEVVLVRRGRLVDAEPHLARLERSLTELDIPVHLSRPAVINILHEVIRRNRVLEGFVYLQATRGVAPRDHVFPGQVKPAFVCSAKRRDWPAEDAKAKGVAGITLLDERWARCDIKSVGLLPNILAKEKARKAGAAEAILVSADGIVREGGSSNVWVVDSNGVLHTHPLDNHILGGVTRGIVKSLAEGAQVRVSEVAFTKEDLMNAKEVFVTSATSFIKPIVAIDGQMIADGNVGPVSERLFGLYNAHTLAGN
ncbi:MAG: D-amino-acid transaminase [Alphaproteobacteria bacterium]